MDTILPQKSRQFKKTVIDYVKEFLPWRIHHEKGVIVTIGSTQLALRNIFATLQISMFFPKVDKKIGDSYENNEFLGLGLDMGYEKTG